MRVCACMCARAKVVTRWPVPRQLIGLLGRVPCLTEQQLDSAISLALSGCIGYYARSTVVTWEDCVKIEHRHAWVRCEPRGSLKGYRGGRYAVRRDRRRWDTNTRTQ